jgi:hypothetical protein
MRCKKAVVSDHSPLTARHHPTREPQRSLPAVVSFARFPLDRVRPIKKLLLLIVMIAVAGLAARQLTSS